jgi:hypothetical protein
MAKNVILNSLFTLLVHTALDSRRKDRFLIKEIPNGVYSPQNRGRLEDVTRLTEKDDRGADKG